ncbi:hypothetical protein C8Q75DRAFT_252876 [Abortiporus biennis]|nr:hypothetical protein C8Q75DRAFT_252876 [Abortiporus biennis]
MPKRLSREEPVRVGFDQLPLRSLVCSPPSSSSPSIPTFCPANELCFQQAFSSSTNISTSSSPQTSSVNSTLSGLYPPVNSVYSHRRIFPSIMSDLLSLSLFQLLSVISFLTSVFAVLRVGGSLHKLSNRFEHDVAHSPTDLPDGKSAMWNWSLSGLPVSFSLNTLIGDDESVNDETKDLEGYSDGSQELVLPLDWKAPKSSNRALPPMQFTQPPASMAKLIMSRHVQRKGHRVPRRMPGMPRPTPPSRLMHSSSQYSS